MILSGGVNSDAAGQSAEVYVPSTGQHCTLPSLPDMRWWHTMEGRMVCGGGDEFGPGTTLSTSCITLTDAGWETTTTLLESR